MKIGVLMGGESQEREVSRVTGTAVARALAERGWEVTLLDTRDGIRALGEEGQPAIGSTPPEPSDGSDATAEHGLVPVGPAAIQEFARSLTDVGVVFIALHGGWGEDGTIQAVFEMLGIPYTGSGVLGSALAMDKDRSKRVMRASGLRTPEWEVVECVEGMIPSVEALERIRDRLPGTVIVKPNAEGSTVGLHRLEPGEELGDALRDAARFGERVLVEEFIPGRELTVGVLGGEALPIVEIIPEGGLYSYEAKYTKGKSRYVVPADLPESLTADLQRMSVDTFRVLGCEGFARVDYRLAEDGRAYCLEVNTIPGMTPLSLLPMAAQAAGIAFGELVERIVDMGLTRGTRRTRSGAGVEG
ncbi:D-alanine--D-alanine ligase [bacterium]|nr:D-alanine--D-alanine ligase [bacterium]